MKISYPATTSKYYFGPLEYNGSTLEALYHEEGRAIPDGNGGYDYEIKTMKKSYIPPCLCYFFILTGIMSCSYFQPPPKIDAEKIRRVNVYALHKGVMVEPGLFDSIEELKIEDDAILKYEIKDRLLFKKIVRRIANLRKAENHWPGVRVCCEIELTDNTKFDLCFDNSGEIILNNQFFEKDPYLLPLIESYLPQSYREPDSSEIRIILHHCKL
ncbi:MAG: hypothetical protein SF052_06150 [Bacteroidia bacterium]|nr:hypothetical protein [Bacteroidia bacterium]